MGRFTDAIASRQKPVSAGGGRFTSAIANRATKKNNDQSGSQSTRESRLADLERRGGHYEKYIEQSPDDSRKAGLAGVGRAMLSAVPGSTVLAPTDDPNADSRGTGFARFGRDFIAGAGAQVGGAMVGGVPGMAAGAGVQSLASKVRQEKIAEMAASGEQAKPLDWSMSGLYDSLANEAGYAKNILSDPDKIAGIAIDTAASAASGALGSRIAKSGLGLAGKIAANVAGSAPITAAQSLGNAYFEDREITGEDFAKELALDAALNLVGEGVGARHAMKGLKPPDTLKTPVLADLDPKPEFDPATNPGGDGTLAGADIVRQFDAESPGMYRAAQEKFKADVMAWRAAQAEAIASGQAAPPAPKRPKKPTIEDFIAAKGLKKPASAAISPFESGVRAGVAQAEELAVPFAERVDRGVDAAFQELDPQEGKFGAEPEPGVTIAPVRKRIQGAVEWEMLPDVVKQRVTPEEIAAFEADFGKSDMDKVNEFIGRMEQRGINRNIFEANFAERMAGVRRGANAEIDRMRADRQNPPVGPEALAKTIGVKDQPAPLPPEEPTLDYGEIDPRFALDPLPARPAPISRDTSDLDAIALENDLAAREAELTPLNSDDPSAWYIDPEDDQTLIQDLEPAPIPEPGARVPKGLAQKPVAAVSPAVAPVAPQPVLKPVGAAIPTTQKGGDPSSAQTQPQIENVREGQADQGGRQEGLLTQPAPGPDAASETAKAPAYKVGDSVEMKEKAVSAGNLDPIRYAKGGRMESGWHYVEGDNGASLVHPTENRAVTFNAKDRKSGTALMRAKIDAQQWAAQNPVTVEPPALSGELVTRPLYDAPVKAKEPWERTFDAIKADQTDMPVNGVRLPNDTGGEGTYYGFHGKNQHKHLVEAALSKGKPVPPEVLADYPDLAKKYAQDMRGEPESTAPVEAGDPKISQPSTNRPDEGPVPPAPIKKGQLVQVNGKGEYRVVATDGENVTVQNAEGKTRVVRKPSVTLYSFPGPLIEAAAKGAGKFIKGVASDVHAAADQISRVTGSMLSNIGKRNAAGAEIEARGRELARIEATLQGQLYKEAVRDIESEFSTGVKVGTKQAKVRDWAAKENDFVKDVTTPSGTVIHNSNMKALAEAKTVSKNLAPEYGALRDAVHKINRVTGKLLADAGILRKDGTAWKGWSDGIGMVRNFSQDARHWLARGSGKEFNAIVDAIAHANGISPEAVKESLSADGFIGTKDPERSVGFVDFRRSLKEMPTAVTTADGKYIKLLEDDIVRYAHTLARGTANKAAWQKAFGKPGEEDFATKLVQEFGEQGGDLKEVNALFSALQGRSLGEGGDYVAGADPNGPKSNIPTRLLRHVGWGTIREANLSMSAIANIGQTLFFGAPTAGTKNFAKALLKVARSPIEGSEKFKESGAISDKVQDFFIHNGSRIEGIAKAVQGRSPTHQAAKFVNDLNDHIMAQAGENMVQEIKANKNPARNRTRLQGLKFSDAQIDAMLSGKGDTLLADVPRRLVVQTQFSGGNKAEYASILNSDNPWMRMMTEYQRYTVGTVEKLADLARVASRAVESGDAKRIAASAAQIAAVAFGIKGADELTNYIKSKLTGTEYERHKFWESMVEVGLIGPFRGVVDVGAEGEDRARKIFRMFPKGRFILNIIDAIDQRGEFANKTGLERAQKLATKQAPVLKIRRGIEVLRGLRDPAVDAARIAAFDYARDLRKANDPEGDTPAYNLPSGYNEATRQVRKALDAMLVSDRAGAKEAVKTLGNIAKDEELANKINPTAKEAGRYAVPLLTRIEGMKLLPSMKDRPLAYAKMSKALGPEKMAALKRHDAMIEKLKLYATPYK